MPGHTMFCPICRGVVAAFVVPSGCTPRHYALRPCKLCLANGKQHDLDRVAARRRAELAPLATNQALAEARDKKRRQKAALRGARRRKAAAHA